MDLDISIRVTLIGHDIYLETSALQYSVDSVLYVVLMIAV